MPKKTYKVGEDLYDIEENEAGSFLKDMPKAVEVKSFVLDKDTFDIPVNEVNDFIKDMPNAKPLYGEKKKNGSQPTFSTSVEDYTKPLPSGAEEVSQSPLKSNLKSEIPTVKPIIEKKPVERIGLYTNTLNNIQKRTSENLLLADQFKQQGDEQGMRNILTQIDQDQKKIEVLNKGIDAQKQQAQIDQPNTISNNLLIGGQQALGMLARSATSLDESINIIKKDLWASVGLAPSKESEAAYAKFLEESKGGFKQPSDIIAQTGKDLIKAANEKSEIKNIGLENGGSAWESLKDGKIAQAADYGFKGFIGSIPTSALFLNPYTATAISGGTVGSQLDEAIAEKGSANANDLAAGVIKAGLEVITERMFGAGKASRELIAKFGKETAERMAKEAIEAALKKTLTSKLGKNTAEEIGGEVVNQIGSNVVDKYILDKKNVGLFDGVGDAAIISLFAGGGQGGATTTLNHYIEKKQAAKHQELKTKADDLMNQSLDSQSQVVSNALEKQAEKLHTEADKIAEEQNKIGEFANKETVQLIEAKNSELDELEQAKNDLSSADNSEAIIAIDSQIKETEKEHKLLVEQAKQEADINQETIIETPEETKTPPTPSSNISSEVQTPINITNNEQQNEVGKSSEQLREEEVALENKIIVSGLSDGWTVSNKTRAGITKDSIQYKEAFDPRNESGENSGESFIKIIEKKGKKYRVLGLRMSNPETVLDGKSNRSGMSYATIEDNGNLPDNIDELLIKKAIQEGKNLYENIVKLEDSDFILPKEYKPKETTKPIEVVAENKPTTLPTEDKSKEIALQKEKGYTDSILYKGDKDLKGNPKEDWMNLPSRSSNIAKQKAIIDKAVSSGSVIKAYNEGRISAEDIWILAMNKDVSPSLLKNIPTEILEKGSKEEQAFNESFEQKTETNLTEKAPIGETTEKPTAKETPPSESPVFSDKNGTKEEEKSPFKNKSKQEFITERLDKIQEIRKRIEGTSEEKKKRYDKLSLELGDGEKAIVQMMKEDSDNIKVEIDKLPKIPRTKVEEQQEQGEKLYNKAVADLGFKSSERQWGDNVNPFGDEMGDVLQNKTKDASIFIKPNEVEVEDEENDNSIENVTNGVKVELLYTDPKERGKGKAKELLRKVTKWADENNATLFLDIAPQDDATTEEGLKKLYEAEGFVFDQDNGQRKPNSQKSSKKATEKATKALNTAEVEAVTKVLAAEEKERIKLGDAISNRKRKNEADKTIKETENANAILAITTNLDKIREKLLASGDIKAIDCSWVKKV